jgi:hypothetical protein
VGARGIRTCGYRVVLHGKQRLETIPSARSASRT